MGQVPENTQTENENEQPQEGNGGEFDAAYVAELRKEAAKYRVQLREAEKRLTELTEKATAAQTLAQEIESLRDKLNEQERTLARREREAKALKIATKAGVDPDIVELLDLERVPLDDEDAALDVFRKFARPTASGGGASSPPRTEPLTREKLAALPQDEIAKLLQKRDPAIMNLLRGSK